MNKENLELLQKTLSYALNDCPVKDGDHQTHFNTFANPLSIVEDELNKLSVGSVVFSEAELGCSFCGTNDGLKHGYMSNGNRCPRYKPN